MPKSEVQNIWTDWHELGFLVLYDSPYETTPPQVWEPIIVIRPEVVRVHQTARIDSWVKIEGGQGVTIGRWVHIASFCHINIGGGEVVFEEGSCAASGVKVIAGSNSPEGISCSAAAPKEQQVVKRTKVVIQKNAALFAGAQIHPGVTVGEGAIVGGGAVVRHDVPAYEIWAGNPARKIGERARP
jgi:acetyltransferase-like isoleucine patch superfamily enzyme